MANCLVHLLLVYSWALEMANCLVLLLAEMSEALGYSLVLVWANLKAQVERLAWVLLWLDWWLAVYMYYTIWRDVKKGKIRLC